MRYWGQNLKLRIFFCFRRIKKDFGYIGRKRLGIIIFCFRFLNTNTTQWIGVIYYKKRSFHMKKMAFYISDYGFGHAARSISIIRELLNLRSNIHFVICTSFATTFLKQSLPSPNVSFRSTQTDVGYFLNEQSIKPDIEKIVQEYNVFVENWKEKVEGEKKFLLEEKIDFVISDISPLPFEAASELGILSVGISNFTWYTAYKGIIEEERLDIFKTAYEKMNYFFQLAGYKERDWLANKRYYSFYARKVNSMEVERIKKLVNPDGSKVVIFFGLGMKVNNLDVQSLPLWNSANCVFIVSSNVKIHKENVFSIPFEDTESQNYIAASDLVISKAGWGTISEAVVNGIPLLILNRKELKEDQNTISYIREHQLGEVIEWEEFLTYQINDISKNAGNDYENEVDRIAGDLISLMES